MQQMGSQSAVPRHVQAEGERYSRAEPSYSQESESQTWRYSRRGGASLQPHPEGAVVHSAGRSHVRQIGDEPNREKGTSE